MGGSCSVFYQENKQSEHFKAYFSPSRSYKIFLPPRSQRGGSWSWNSERVFGQFREPRVHCIAPNFPEVHKLQWTRSWRSRVLSCSYESLPSRALLGELFPSPQRTWMASVFDTSGHRLPALSKFFWSTVTEHLLLPRQRCSDTQCVDKSLVHKLLVSSKKRRFLLSVFVQHFIHCDITVQDKRRSARVRMWERVRETCSTTFWLLAAEQFPTL